MLPLLTLKHSYEHGAEVICLITISKELEYKLRLFPGIRWSQRHRCWFFPLSKEKYIDFKAFTDGHAVLELSELRTYFEQRNVLPQTTRAPSTKKMQQLKEYPNSTENMPKLKGCSANTFRTNTGDFERLLRLLGIVSVNYYLKSIYSLTIFT